jgi:hypothetical protein
MVQSTGLITRHMQTETKRFSKSSEPSLTAKRHPRFLGTCRQTVGVGPRAIHRFWRMATDSRSAWLHESCRVREEGSGRVGEVVMDGVTAEILAAVVRLLQRAGQLAWVQTEGEAPRSPRHWWR